MNLHTRYGIGIDTGGTFTDAVIWDLDHRKVLSSNKAHTTHDDLAIGILNALDGLDPDMARQAQIVCLSTTLATNACVENKVSKSKLLFIGVNPKAVAWVGAEAGLTQPELICYAPDESWRNPEDWSDFLDEQCEWFHDANTIGIVALNAHRDHGACEKAARNAIAEKFGLPAICGYELGSELNSIRRGASALLNGGLICIIAEFVTAVRLALESRQISAPIAIMSSNGTLMPSRFAEEHPVETILCGPAASVMGGGVFTDSPNSVIVDMGGTTTDIALIRNNVPVQAREGIQIGRWQTSVKGVFVRTLGLGGDSAIRVDRQTHHLYIDTVRVVPLCYAADQYPQIISKLQDLIRSTDRHTIMLHEFYIRQKDIENSSCYSEQEKSICRLLGDGPLSLLDTAAALDIDVYNLHLERLEQENVIMRCGLTPTDIMRLKGDICAFSETASYLGATFVANCVNSTVDKLCDWVYCEVSKKIYLNIAQILLQEKIPLFNKQGVDEQITCCLESIWESHYSPTPSHMDLSLSTTSILVGVGAPIHIFLPKVAQALGTECIIPEHAAVVNAVGAVACNITVSRTVSITSDGHSFWVPTQNDIVEVKSYDMAISLAKKEAKDIAYEAALARGATGEAILEFSIVEKVAPIGYGGEVFIGADVTVTLIATPNLY